MRGAEVGIASAAAIERRRVLIALVAVAALLVPAALAWACGPNRAFQLSHSSCEPACSMTASGSNYPAGSTLTLSLEPGGQVGSVTVPASGSFSMSFTAPSGAGSYVVLLQGFDADGNYVQGTPARQSFSVVAPPPQPVQQPDSGPAADATPSQSESPAPSASAPAQSDAPATPPRASTPGSATPSTSGRNSERPAARNTPGARGDDSRGSASRAGSTGSRPAVAQPGAAAEPVGVVNRAGEQVFAGSISRSERTTSAAGKAGKAAKAPAASSSSARPSDTSANAEVWSGFSPSGGPSLLPQASAVGAPEAGPESALFYGVLLLGLGSLALVGGLAIAARRRRA